MAPSVIDFTIDHIGGIKGHPVRVHL